MALPTESRGQSPRSGTSTARQRTPLHPDLVDFDPLSRDLWVDMPGLSAEGTSSSTQSDTTAPAAHTMHIKLPPRPSEIDNEDMPAARSPRRFSDLLNFAGPSSPPRLSSAGGEIVFHPSSPTAETAMGDLARMHSRESGPRRRSSHNTSRDPPNASSPSKVLNTLASGSKLASRWRKSIDTVRPGNGISGLPDDTEKGPGDELSFDEPIVSHSSPFASAERIAGSYVPPTGAPGFQSHAVPPGRDHLGDVDDATGEVRLKGRRPTTAPLLDETLAGNVS